MRRDEARRGSSPQTFLEFLSAGNEELPAKWKEESRFSGAQNPRCNILILDGVFQL
jgi:hypothetical protein